MHRGQGDEAMAGNGQPDGAQQMNRWRVAAWSVVALILLLPAVAMQFTDEVNWGPVDFVAAAVLLGGTLGMFELFARRSSSFLYRTAVGVGLAASLFLVWANLAVGIIGSEDEPANLMYYGVLAVGLLGASRAGFRPGGMARTLFAMAGAVALVAAIALIGGLGSPANGPVEILSVNGLFVVLFSASALLFREAARTGAHGPA